MSKPFTFTRMQKHADDLSYPGIKHLPKSIQHASVNIWPLNASTAIWPFVPKVLTWSSEIFLHLISDLKSISVRCKCGENSLWSKTTCAVQTVGLPLDKSLHTNLCSLDRVRGIDWLLGIYSNLRCSVIVRGQTAKQKDHLN